MAQTKPNRSHLVTLRLTTDEQKRLNEQWKSTSCRKRSEYLRKKLFSQSLVTLVRDQTLDDVMTEYIRLRKDFNGVTNNFNQLVRKLHSAVGAAEFKLWAARAEGREREVLVAIARVEIIIKKVMQKWLQ